MEKIKVENHPNLYRDVKTNMIINSDINSYESYLSLKKVKQSEKNRIESLEKNVSDIQSDLDEIKNMLRSLVNGSR